MKIGALGSFVCLDNYTQGTKFLFLWSIRAHEYNNIADFGEDDVLVYLGEFDTVDDIFEFSKNLMSNDKLAMAKSRLSMHKMSSKFSVWIDIKNNDIVFEQTDSLETYKKNFKIFFRTMEV